MSGPYVYKPAAGVHYSAQFEHTPYYVHTPRTGTPFIPDSALYPSSPYSNPGSLHPSPNRSAIPLPATAAVDHFAFPSLGPESDYSTPWDRYNRERRPSWHAPNDGQWLEPPIYPIGVGLNRRHSFGASARPAPFQGGALFINPWINAESPRGDFFFDLALPSFTPLRLYGPGQSALLPTEEMVQPATHPPVTRLRIICERLPQWSCELQLDPYQTGGYQPPPISLSDVLVAVHRNVQKQITHTDWARLTEQEEIAVSRAFTRRCRAIPTAFEQERGKGVKRVDYLLGKTRMIGLVKVTRSDGWEVMRLIVE